jgi:hypothetical protein
VIEAIFKLIKGKRPINWRMGVIIQGKCEGQDYMFRIRRWCWTREELLIVEGECLGFTERVCNNSVGQNKWL